MRNKDTTKSIGTYNQRINLEEIFRSIFSLPYGHKKAPKYFYSEASSKTATTYSPTCTQYHRRGEA